MKMKTTEELKTVPFETYARVLDRAVKAEAERDALHLFSGAQAAVIKEMREALVPFASYYANTFNRAALSDEDFRKACAALAPSPAGREERHEMTSIGDKEPD